jgi:SAM-dependent methyltransferase
MGWSEDAARNRELWTTINEEFTAGQAVRKWTQDEMGWGVWDAPESELQALGDVSGIGAVELGCGTAYLSAWLARRGARPVGVGVTSAQLGSAREWMRETRIEFPLVEADAAATGLPDASADLVVSEYGASIWVDPHRWIPEAARLLRPGGRLVFLRHAPLLILCLPDDGPADERLRRPQFGTSRLEWPEGGVELTLAHGELIALLRDGGFEVERLEELQAPARAEDHDYYDSVGVAWASGWPAEELWVARRR